MDNRQQRTMSSALEKLRVLGERLCGQQRTTGVLPRGGFGECAWRDASWTQRMMFLVSSASKRRVQRVCLRDALWTQRMMFLVVESSSSSVSSSSSLLSKRTRRGCIGGQFGSVIKC